MLFANKIRRLREEQHLLQRQLAAALEIDTPMYSKIERGERPAKRTQVVVLAKLLSTDVTELLTLWLADKVLEVLDGEKELAEKALKTVMDSRKK
ncbi:MAG: helix-turn-helix transcriptional regulator [Paludibacter sp.]|nr:helix-turn-helix transcriptional regulator [Paludibacter sp.]